MERKTQSKTVAVTTHKQATKHTWLITKVPDVHPATSEGYKPEQMQYTKLGPGVNASSYDLYKLKQPVGMTEPEFEMLARKDFEWFEDGATYEVESNDESENGYTVVNKL